jgi:membrane protein implicated in regulation of membrane protease activity
MSGLEWWHWAVIAFGCLMVELFFLPAFVLIWFGAGALLVMAAVLLFAPGFTAQIVLWTVLSGLLVILWFKYLKSFFRTRSLAGQSSAAIIGEIGMISEVVGPFRPGRVRFQKPIVGSDIWDCVADEAFEVGTKVRVTKVEGNLLTVGRRES